MTARIALFDLGNVVVDWEPARLYRQMMDEDAAAHFCAHVCTLDWHNLHDRGVPMADNAAALIAEHPDKADFIHAWSSRWLDMFHGLIDGVPQLINALKQNGVKVYALTNFPGEKWDETANAFPILQAFEDVVISSEVKMAKPDVEIYELTLARMGHPDPSDVFFTDDRQENIDAAQALGMRGHLFETPQKLESALKAARLL